MSCLSTTYLALCALSIAAPAPSLETGPGLVPATLPQSAEALDRLDERADIPSNYAPKYTSCPSADLVRPATSINPDESSYVTSRKANADKALVTWLQKQGNFSTTDLPTIGFTSSGGGLRAMLSTAGVIQALDDPDGSHSTSGLYQALTYQAGLSGGAWFLSSLAGNNWPTVSELKNQLWIDSLDHSLLLPANLASIDAATEYPVITTELLAKQVAGYDLTLIDAWGRLLGYQLLGQQHHGGVAVRLSGLTSLSNFTDHNVPYPILTALGVEGAYLTECYADDNVTHYECHPYEYGSWDDGVSTFASTQYMGTPLSDGQSTKTTTLLKRKQCVVQYDNLGYIMGTSSDIFGALCQAPPASKIPWAPDLKGIAPLLEDMITKGRGPVLQDIFGVFPNPFAGYERAADVQEKGIVNMVDGGLAGQNNPIWPFIRPERHLDILIVNDNSGDTADNYPNGTEIYHTYLNAQAAGLSRMPLIPDVQTFIGQNLHQRATFFGCNQTEGTVLIVYLPNSNYTYPSGTSTFKMAYSAEDTKGMIANRNQIASQGDDEGWPVCLACAIKHKDRGTARWPEGCEKCFQHYCYHE